MTVEVRNQRFCNLPSVFELCRMALKLDAYQLLDLIGLCEEDRAPRMACVCDDSICTDILIRNMA